MDVTCVRGEHECACVVVPTRAENFGFTSLGYSKLHATVIYVFASEAMLLWNKNISVKEYTSRVHIYVSTIRVCAWDVKYYFNLALYDTRPF